MKNTFPIDTLIKLATPAKRALQNANIQSLNDFGNFTETEIASLHGIGLNALEKIKEAMKQNQITFRKQGN
jgi:DNA-directed RNA polymerase alpha subunit